MYYSKNLLQDYGLTLSNEELEKNLIQLGHEVEEFSNNNIEGLVVGYVSECIKHPDADKLQILNIDIRKEQLQIVCGALNVAQGQKVIVATNGTYIPSLDLKIKPIKLKGVESNGMVCSLQELGYNHLSKEEHDGIYVLSNDIEVGTSLSTLLDDYVIDVSLTANRGDCMSYKGILKDLSSLSKVDLSFFDINEYKPTIKNEMSIKDNVKDNKAFTHAIIKDIKSYTLTEQEKFLLLKHKINITNTIVDLSNLAMLLFGQPLHMYDLSKIDKGLSANLLSKPTNFVGIDKREYELPKDTLVIEDNSKLVAVAGVIGSDNTKVTKDTKDVLIEIANFDSVLVRKNIKKLNLKTDASMRFEKGVDLEIINNTYNFLASRINGDISEIKGNISKPNNKSISLEYSVIKRILGIDIEPKEVKSILESLSFEIKDVKDTSIEVIPPSFRHDIFNDNDLVEELLRVKGIDCIKTDESIFGTTSVTRKSSNEQKVIDYLEEKFLALGLDQVQTYSLISKEESELFNVQNNDAIEIMHPLSNERRCFRQSLLSSLITCAKQNQARGLESVEIFEIANTYFQAKEVKERKILSGLLMGNKDIELSKVSNYDFYDLKGILETVISPIVNSFEIRPLSQEVRELNSHASADIIINNNIVGFIGLIHPMYDKKLKEEIFIFEMDLTLIIEDCNLENEYTQLSTKPSLVRELTFYVKEEELSSSIQEIFKNVEYLESISILNIYTGDKIQEGTKAISYKLVFRNFETTLTSEDVNDQVLKIIESAKKKGYDFNE